MNIRELNVPVAVIEKLAAIGIHRVDEWALRSVEKELRSRPSVMREADLTDDEAEAFLRAIWDQCIGMPLKTRRE